MGIMGQLACFRLISNDNPLAVYELSARMPFADTTRNHNQTGVSRVNRQLSLCALALAGLISFGAIPTDAAAAATRTRAKTSAKSPRVTAKTSAVKKSTAAVKKSTRAKRTTAYSAARSRSRKLTLARARAAAMAREMADTALPRYKVDASGDLVPDLRAAAAIIYNPDDQRGALGRELAGSSGRLPASRR